MILDRVLTNTSCRIVICAVLLAIISGTICSASADDLDRSSIEDLMQRRDNVLRNLKAPLNGYEHEAQKKSSGIMEKIYSDDFQKQLQAQTNRLKGTIFKDHVTSFETPAGTNNDRGSAVSGRLLPDERLYIFVSSSVPVRTLRNYAVSIDKIGDPQIIMVMRGFPGGMKDWSAMLNFSSKVLVRNLSCDPQKEQCDMYAANLQVDPLLFRRYNIAYVPSVVYARGVKRVDPIMSEGLSDSTKVSEFHSIQGDVSLEYFLETIRRESGSTSIDAVLTALRKSNRDGE